MGGFEAVGSIALGGIHEEKRRCDKHGEFTSRQWTSSIWSGCPQCAEDTKAARRLDDERLAWERRKMDEQTRVEGNLNRAMIPARFRGRTFDNFVADTDAKRHVLEVARNFQANGSGLVFSGRPGTGKSHLACAILQEVINGGGTGMYATVRDLVLMLRDTWRNGSTQSERDLLRTLMSLDVLALDEVGVGFGSDAEKTQFFDVIDGRYRECKSTILLTNLDKSALEEYIGQRAFDRLREDGQWIAFDWDSYRGRA